MAAASRNAFAPVQPESLEPRCVPASDVVLSWNAAALDAIRAEKTPPPASSRALAIVQIAVFDAVNAIDGGYISYSAPLDAPTDASEEAAAAVAAHDALAALFPKEKAAFDARLAADLAAIPDGFTEDEGVAVGRAAAAQILALRANDGSKASLPPYLGNTAPGQWRPTPPANAPGLLPQWGDVTPFAEDSAGELQVDPPPSLTSKEYADALQEVKDYGSSAGSLRTADQTAVAKFWADGAGTATPPGHWNAIAASISEQQGLSLVQNARLFALLDIALADAGIDAWGEKYAYNLWRPITAIRNADVDGNPSTAKDATWTPLLTTPNFPSYTSGHSTYSAAAAAVLGGFFGTDQVAFTVHSEDPNLADRSFTSFRQAAREAGQSRIYGGIHFQFDNQAGLASGENIGQSVASSELQERYRSPDERFVANLYTGLLARHATGDEVSAYVARLSNGSSREQIVDEITHSMEFAEHQVNLLYQQILHRNGDQRSLRAYAERFLDERSVEKIAREMAVSEEYRYAHPTATSYALGLIADLGGDSDLASLVAAEYQSPGSTGDSEAASLADQLRKVPAPGDGSYTQDDALSFASRAIRSTLFGEGQTVRIYKALLDRETDPAGLKGYSERIAEGDSLQEILAEISLSKEFEAR